MDKYIIDISKNATSKKIYRIIENIKEVSNEIFIDDEDTGLVIDEYGKVCETEEEKQRGSSRLIIYC